MLHVDGHGGTCTYPVSLGSDSCPIVEGARTYTVTAAYGGDTNYRSGSVSKNMTIAKATPGLLLSSGANPAPRPGPVIYSVFVNGGSGPAPTGSVAVSDGRGGTCTITLGAAGGNCAITEPKATLSVSFTYHGDSNYNAVTKVMSQRVS